MWLKALLVNISCIFGKKASQDLCPLNVLLPSCQIVGYLTTTLLSGSVSKLQKDQLLTFLNFRPIEMPKRIRKLLEEVYKQYNPAGSVWIVWNFIVEDGKYDINVSPDKREVVLAEEAAIVEGLTVKLTEIFEGM